MLDTALNSRGDQQLTVDGTAGGLGLTKPTNIRPRHALIYVGGADVRFLATTAPTATLGILVPAGSYIDWTDPNTDYSGLIDNVKFIRATGVSATLDIIYFD